MFLDSSGLLCLHHADEPGHHDARVVFDAAGPKVVHSYVLAELVALALARGVDRRETLGFLDGLLAQPDVRVVWVDRNLHDRAMDLLRGRLDKTYSLCDAVSFLVMQARGTIEALTTDHHFEQAGFVRLLRP